MRLVFILIAGCFCHAVPAHPGGVDSNGCHVEESSGEKHCHPQRATNKPPPSVPQRPPRAGDEGVFSGPFISLTDGDTFHAKIQGVVMEFRLSDIDAPEHDQPYGRESRDALRSLIADRSLVMVFVDVDRYGRIVAEVWAGDVDVNREMVRRGAAWFYPDYARNEFLYYVEEEARAAARGLWALPGSERVEPWVWRDRKRQSRGTASPKEATTR